MAPAKKIKKEPEMEIGPEASEALRTHEPNVTLSAESTRSKPASTTTKRGPRAKAGSASPAEPGIAEVRVAASQDTPGDELRGEPGPAKARLSTDARADAAAKKSVAKFTSSTPRDVAPRSEAPRGGARAAREETARSATESEATTLRKAQPVAPAVPEASGTGSRMPTKAVTLPAAAEPHVVPALTANDRKSVTKKIEKKVRADQQSACSTNEVVRTGPAAPVAAGVAAGTAPKPAPRVPAVKAPTSAPEAVSPAKGATTVAAPDPGAVDAARAKPAMPRPAESKPTKASSAARLGFKPQEFIVYPAHGVGQIVAIEEQEVAGFKLELFVISFIKDKMILKVPTAKAAMVGMRKLADAVVVAKSFDTLGGRARVKRTMWSRRAQEYEAKINSGDLVAIAEVVRDLFRSDTQPEQSYSERQLYEAALDRMTREIVVVQKLTETEALRAIEAQLMKGPRRGKAEEIETEETDIEEAA
jgi:CarD family transcriptional regulator